MDTRKPVPTSIVLADVIANNVALVLLGERELAEDETRSLVVVRIVVLQNRVLCSAVQIKASAVNRARPISERLVVLNNEPVHVPHPDAKWSSFRMVVQPAVVI